MGKARAFLEVFASALNEDFRFPVLEIFAFIHPLVIFVSLYFITGGGPGGQTGLFFQLIQLAGPEEVKVLIVGYLAGLFTFAFVSPIFGMLILKNIAYSFGNDLERGVIQNILSYPLKRRSLLTAKLLSSIGVVYMLSVGIQIFELFILVPNIVSQHIALLLFVLVAGLSFPFLVAGLVLILTLFLKRGSKALFVGIALYFSSFFLMMILLVIAGGTGSDIVLKIAAIIFPGLALQLHYKAAGLDPLYFKLWTPSFTQSVVYVGAGYALAFLILAVGYLYFERRLEV